MKVSQNNQRLQKTKYLGPSAKDRVELENRQRVHREFSATSKRETNEFEYGSLERILSRQNLLQAMNRVISNKGSHGVDGMTVYELKQFLQTNWLKIREDIFNNAYKKVTIIDRINLQIGWLHNCYYHVVDTCKEHIKELETYSWLEDKDNTPEDRNDHTINSSQYAWIPYINKIGVDE